MTNTNLKSGDPNVRREEVEKYFYEVPDDSTLKELVSLLEDPDKGVRNSLSILLTTTENPNVSDYIVRFVSSEDISVRNMAGDILLKNGDKSIDSLIRYIDVGDDDDKKFCIDLLGLIRNNRPAEKIIEVLRSNKNSNVILACLEALGNLGFEQALEDIKPFYLENELYKATVIEALGKMGSRAVQDFLLELYPKEDELSKYAIIESISLIGDSESLKMLMEELRNSDSFMIGPLVNAIYHVKQRAGLEIIMKESCSHKIIADIDHLETKYIKPALDLVQNTPGIDLMNIYVRVFGRDIELDEAVKPMLLNDLTKLFSYLPEYFETSPDNKYEILTFIKEVLFISKEEYDRVKESEESLKFTTAVQGLLSDENEDIRSLACDLLFNLNEDSAITASKIILNDENMWNRINLLENLSNVDYKKVDSLLKELVNDSEEMVRERAVFLLEQNHVN